MATTCSGPGGTGPKYDFAELEGLWINAGGSKAVAPIAAAIALAESGGCAVAQNPNDNGGTQTSWGLWQISNGTHSEPAQNIYTPAVNALQAVTKYQQAGNSFRDWGTFNSGAYKGFLSNATPNLNVPGSTEIGGAVNTGGDQSACQHPDCAWGCVPSVAILGVTVWSGECIVTFKQARRAIGAGIFVGGALVMGAGMQMLVGLAALGVASKVVTPVVSRIAGAKRAARQVQNLGS